MPELPEVETIKRDIEKVLVGHKIVDIWYDWPKQLKPSPEAFKKAVIGKTFKSVARRAKLLILRLNGVILVVHLKLTGRFLYRDQKDPPDQFVRILLKLDKGKEIRFADLRKFGWMRVVKDEGELDDLLKEFGIEPFTPEFTLENFKKAIGNKKTAIKPLIMDQKIIAGVGNIYADESLWAAKIHPMRRANTLSESELKKLFEAVQIALEEGIKDRGTSVDMYLDLFGEKGKHADNLKVFRKEKGNCPRCGGPLKKIRVAGRGTHFCPNCQKNDG